MVNTCNQGSRLRLNGRILRLKFETVRVNFSSTRACATGKFDDFPFIIIEYFSVADSNAQMSWFANRHVNSKRRRKEMNTKEEEDGPMCVRAGDEWTL